MAESKWKQIVGKKISESAYVGPNLLREDFIRAMSSLGISNGNGETTKKVSALEEENQKLRGMVSKLTQEKEQLERTVLKVDSNSMVRQTDTEEAFRKLTEQFEALKAQLPKRKGR